MEPKPAANRALPALLVLASGLYLLYLLAPILTPFLLAAALAYLCDPLVDRLEARRLPRTAGTALVLAGLVLVAIALGLILAPLVQAEMRLLLNQLPLVLEWAQRTLLPWIKEWAGIDLTHDQAQISDWLRGQVGQAGQLAGYLPRLADGGLAVLGFLANLVLVPVVTFYLLRDWDRIVAHLGGWVPAPLQVKTFEIAREIDAVLAEFVRGQLAVIGVMAVYYSLALWLVGLDYALAVGIVAGVLVFVPYLGMIVGLTLATLAGLAQHGDLVALIPVWAVFGFGQLLEGFAVTPRLVGERVGLHPVAVIFALMAFGQLFGFFGILLAIPASAALLVGLRHLKRHLD